MSSSNPGLVSGAAHLLDNDKFSDLKIKCEDHQISAHKLIICTPSDVLDAMCTAGFQESQSNTIDLSSDTKRVVYRMVEFLYRGDYQDLEHPDYLTIDTPTDSSGARHALLHAAMYAVADKYNIPPLASLSLKKFTYALINVSITDADFLSVIEYVYNTTPDSNRNLRDVIVAQTRTRGRKIITDAVLSARLEEITSSVPQFAWDMIQKSLQPGLSKGCDGCRGEFNDAGICAECGKNKGPPRASSTLLFPATTTFNTATMRGRGLF